VIPSADDAGVLMDAACRRKLDADTISPKLAPAWLIAPVCRCVEHGMSDAPLIAIVDDDVIVCEATKDLVLPLPVPHAFAGAARILGAAVVLIDDLNREPVGRCCEVSARRRLQGR
jgi:hypothetical protein